MEVKILCASAGSLDLVYHDLFTMMPQMAFADEQAVAPQEVSSVSGGERIIVSSAAELAALGGKELRGTVELAADIDMSGTTM